MQEKNRGNIFLKLLFFLDFKKELHIFIIMV